MTKKLNHIAVIVADRLPCLILKAAAEVLVYAAQEALGGTALVQNLFVGSQPRSELGDQRQQEAICVLSRAHPKLGSGFVVRHNLAADVSNLLRLQPKTQSVTADIVVSHSQLTGIAQPFGKRTIKGAGRNRESIDKRNDRGKPTSVPYSAQ